MSNSLPEPMKVLEWLGKTPGYTLKAATVAKFRVQREALPDFGIDAVSMTFNSRAQYAAHGNQMHALRRRLGWTTDLYEDIEAALRRHREAGTEPHEEILRLRLEAIGYKPKTAPDAAPDDEQAAVPRPRHNRKQVVSAPASRRKAGKAIVGAETLPDASGAVQVIEGVGRVQAEVIDMHRAYELLLTVADYQRDQSRRKVDDYAAKLQRGEWLLNPADPICIDTNGRLCNGQHRLAAVVETGVAAQFMVAYDVLPETYVVMDRGKKRNAGDTLSARGEINVARLAATAKAAHLWFNVPDQREWKNQPEVSDEQVVATLEEHPGLRDSVKLGMLSTLKISPSGSCLVHYLCTRVCGGDARIPTAWYKAMLEMDLPKGQPGHTLAMYYMRQLQKGTKRTKLGPGLTQRDLDMYLLIQSWNATAQGREQRLVSSEREKFTIADPIAPGIHHRFPRIEG